jgi:hypothetical protein
MVVEMMTEAYDESVAWERMIDDGGPAPVLSVPPVAAPEQKRSTRPFQLIDEPAAAERAEQRRAARRVFRLGCMACGRAVEPATPVARSARCPHCGGSLLLELTY